MYALNKKDWIIGTRKYSTCPLAIFRDSVNHSVKHFQFQDLDPSDKTRSTLGCILY